MHIRQSYSLNWLDANPLCTATFIMVPKIKKGYVTPNIAQTDIKK